MGNAALTFKQPSFAKLHGSKVNHEHLKIEVVEVEKHSTDSNEECKEECRSSSASSRSHSRSNAVLRRLSERRIRESIATPKRVDRVIELANNQDSEVSGISVLATTILRVIFEEAFDMDHSGRVSKDQFLFTLHNRPDVIPFLMSSLEEHQHSGCITAEEMFAELEKANHHSFITFNEFLAYFAPPKKFIEGCMAGTNLDYKALCSNAHWSYADPLTGPARWHTLSEKNKVAFEGRQQSPINILSFDVDEEVKPKPDTPRLSNGVVIKYNEKGEDPATITNSGYTIQVGWTPGDISVEGKLYRLSQFHFHSPAEHTVDNVQYALEMHLVHVSQQSELAVIGLLFKVGPKANPFLEQFWEQMPMETSDEMALSTELDPRLLKLTDDSGLVHSYYTYDGSLTTPPCSEGVKWIVMESIQECSAQQLEKFQDAIGYQRNFRPIQPLHGRKIKLCKCNCSV